MTDAEIAVKRLTDWVIRHADHKPRAFIGDVTLVLAIVDDAIKTRGKLLDLIRRAYVVLHKPNWEQGETDDELSDAINNTMSNILGNDWAKKAAQAPHCECHERDGSYVCEYCRSQGLRGHMEKEKQ